MSTNNQHYAQLDDLKMYYEIHGQGEPLLFIHGGTAAIESFAHQIPVFSQSFRVIAADCRGHGRTHDTDRPLTYELMADDFVKLLKELNIQQISIIGWSDGGIIGLHLAIHYPELVNKLVLIGTDYDTKGFTDEFLEGLKVSGPDDHLPILIELYKQLSPDGPDHWPILYNKLKNLWLNTSYSEDDLRKIKAPTLIMIGDRDLIKPEHALQMKRLIPNSQLCILPGTGHTGPVDKPAQVNHIISDFLTTHE